MKKSNPSLRGRLVTTLGIALGAILLPIACGDDDEAAAPPAGGKGGSGGSGARDGSAGSSGSSGRGGAGTGGSAGTNGASGSAGTGGSAGTNGASGSAGTGGSAGIAGSGGAPTDGGDGGIPCAAPSDAGRARACLALNPEAITFQSGDPQLDGQGVLIVLVYNTANPGPTTQPIAPPIQYPPPSDAGPTQVSVTALPPVIPIDNLPATVYIRALFVDNPAWFGPPFNRQGLIYGMFVGGINLNVGLEPPPPLREVTLALGAGTVVPMPMRALRKFSTQVALYRTDAGPIQPLDDGQGPLSVAAFRQSDPRNAIVYGGFRGPCVDITKGAVPVKGLFFGDGPLWFAGQVNDFGLSTPNPEGALVSLVPVPSGDAGVVMRIPDSQKVTVGATEYSVTIPQITLTGTIPLQGTPAPFACPVADAGAGPG